MGPGDIDAAQNLAADIELYLTGLYPPRPVVTIDHESGPIRMSDENGCLMAYLTLPAHRRNQPSIIIERRMANGHRHFVHHQGNRADLVKLIKRLRALPVEARRSKHPEMPDSEKWTPPEGKKPVGY